ncbi:transcriptional regulator ATRX homolog isoform X4 [Bombyx mandarina]|uniref:Transcriptional regulator ATRX homolog isoform X4 n=1 Tax=Bombyx mandarina TaxID=7092 RepID=A0A6J2JCP1_BOMMA|nr:transcriptional regulator ATRX homolog isoform X4 [Bombyx mandarina]
MAAEVPVSDVLCEAMEYLSKLGLNLRTRSEKLKEKKIRKDKLRNSHALQKAANKVLLICELSKKSLDNVEIGVRKVLSIVDKSQASYNDGGKSNHSMKEKDESFYKFFEYKSQKLRVRKSVPLKHYLSVKVHARRMPLSMLEKYPINYDCKLYRIRKKKILTTSEKGRRTSDSSVNSEKETIHNDTDQPQVTDASEQGQFPDTSLETSHVLDKSGPNIENEEETTLNVDSLHCQIDTCNLGNNVDEDSHNETAKQYTPGSEKSECEQAEKDSLKKHKNAVSESIQECSRTTEVADNSSNMIGVNNCSRETEDKSIDGPDVNKDLVITTEMLLETLFETETEKPNDVILSEKEEQKKPFIKCVNLNKLLKPDLYQDANKGSKKTGENENEHSELLNTNRKQDSVQKSTRVVSETGKTTIYDTEDNYWKKKREEAKAFKSKQFVISINRLPKLTIAFLHANKLKRIVQNGLTVCKINPEIDKTTKDISREIKSALLNESDSDGFTAGTPKTLSAVTEKIKDSLLIESESDAGGKHSASENYSSKNCESQKEVHKHKSKRKNKDLKSIEIDKINDSEGIKSSENDEEKKSYDTSNIQNSRTESVKTSLLEDSDSNSSKKTLVISRTKENCFNSNDDSKEDDTSKYSECNENRNASDSASKDKNTSTLNLETIKNHTGDENSDNSSKTPVKSNDNSCETLHNNEKKLTPQSKRKRIMESMKAKKMLLSYSSSDEEIQQKTRFKKIKRALLDESSDDESNSNHQKNKEKQNSSEISSSSSERKKKQDSKLDISNKKGNSKNHKAEKEKINNEDSHRSKMVRSKTKPGSSISQNSDTQDDKDVDRLTNLDALEKPRRRETEDKRSRTNNRARSKANEIIGEQMLEPDTSSDVASEAGSDVCEEIPPVTFNNGIEHLSKSELLGESDSSISNEKEKSSENTPTVDESEDDNLKSKRRKANAISSDSEAGSSRKKEDREVKLSDFEDSEESSESNKKSKRKKKGSESDASGSCSDGNKKKRRRIKQINESDCSDSEEETEGRNKHGRKNIRKVMGKDQLEEATKKAARQEKERIARIAERQKLYNNLEFDESGKPDEVVLEKVVLDFDPETKEPLIQVDRGLVKKLKPHQANGIKFMWDACFESVKRIKKDKGSGCILAHCMGLGKTLQVISLTHTLLTHGSLTGVSRVLVVCPLSTVLNWVNEFRMWLKHAENNFEVDVYELSRFKQNSERAFQLSQWYKSGGVCVLGYEMFRNLSADNTKKFKKKMLKNFQESLVDPGPDLVVCDEGHLLKNEKTSLSQSMNKVKTLRRIVLTGTPLQNNLKEYYCMVQFVKPNLLGKYNEYLNRFVNPITNGQYTDSTEHDIRVMKRRSHVLHKMLDGAVQRRDYGVLAPFLPPKHEYVLFITLSEVQVKLYQHYLENYSRRPMPGKSSGFLFPDFQSLQRIWTHPLVLKYNSERYEIMQQKKREREEEDSEGSLVDFIDDDSTPEETSTEESSDDSSDVSDDSQKKSKKKKAAKKSKAKDSKASTRRGTRANPVEQEDHHSDIEEVVEVKNENPTEWWIKLVTEDELEDMRHSHKLVLLFDILRQCEAIGDKLLVFSQSLYSLDLIEHFLGKVDDATQAGRIDEKLGGHMGSWSPGIDYFRLDGSTSCENRSIWCKNFNREDNPRARLFLISTRAGGLGINLVAANRVVIFDVSWNPSHDVQSIFRVYRFGQKKPCYVYRFLAMGTMEEKIYERQVTKQAISKRVIDEQQIDRHYAENDLAELYKFEPAPPAPRELPALPKDRLFAEMLREHELQIYKYHEHDSLLENKEEETLTEEERKAAWEDFENEKNRPPPAPFPSAWPMHNGMMPGLLAQQQQLAYAVAAMLRKDMPNITDSQIRDMLPMIYNSNPAVGMIQKMSEMYKYAQPSMMNPAMMGSAMNAATGSGSSGSSSLQYEPPWQRQQQQQQQMRLQQLMQHQNQMGAKYYAGGLGSRDPVAMALQQQRARDLMLGGTRPRGRPPLQRAPPVAHAPPAHMQDVVNLDSD